MVARGQVAPRRRRRLSHQSVLLTLFPSYPRYEQSNQHEESDNYEPFTH